MAAPVTDLDPGMIGLAGLVLLAVGGLAGYAAGRRARADAAAADDREAAASPKAGCPVEAHVRRGKDDRYGIQIGRWRPGTHELDVDFLTAVQDRKSTALEAIELVRTYFPDATIIQGQEHEHEHEDDQDEGDG